MDHCPVLSNALAKSRRTNLREFITVRSVAPAALQIEAHCAAANLPVSRATRDLSISGALMKTILFASMSTLVLLLSACGGGSGSSAVATSPPPAVVTGVATPTAVAVVTAN
jgi:hypothetical protein